MYGTARATGYGYSLWEFQVFGTTGGGTATAGRHADLASSSRSPASSWEGGNAPAAALDGRTTTRWSSQFSDPQWIQVDLGGTATISQVVLNWEAAYATAYRIETSPNGIDLDHHLLAPPPARGGVETLAVTGTGRYVRLYGTARATGYGYSLWEFQVFGTVDTVDDHAADAVRPDPAAGAPPASSRSSAPADGAMVTTTRRPALSWAAVGGAVRYQVWINISRTDYDFTASGNLIDLYTKVAEPTGTELHADLGPAGPLDLQVVRRRGQRIRRAPPRRTSAGSASTCPRWRPSPTASASSTAAATSTGTARSSRTRTGGSRSRRGSTTSSAG